MADLVGEEVLDFNQLVPGTHYIVLSHVFNETDTMFVEIEKFVRSFDSYIIGSLNDSRYVYEFESVFLYLSDGWYETPGIVKLNNTQVVPYGRDYIVSPYTVAALSAKFRQTYRVFHITEKYYFGNLPHPIIDERFDEKINDDELNPLSVIRLFQYFDIDYAPRDDSGRNGGNRRRKSNKRCKKKRTKRIM